MFNVGDYVLNQKTGHIGQVIGYTEQVIGVLPVGYQYFLKRSAVVRTIYPKLFSVHFHL